MFWFGTARVQDARSKLEKKGLFKPTVPPDDVEEGSSGDGHSEATTLRNMEPWAPWAASCPSLTSILWSLPPSAGHQSTHPALQEHL